MPGNEARDLLARWPAGCAMKKREHTPVTIACIGSGSDYANRRGELLDAVLNDAFVRFRPFRISPLVGPLPETLRGAA